MIIGTAGHIDHGKTTLVHVLTGVDTDRLPEEKRRGITIDLGFAPLALDGIGTVGIVDVPGHEAFVRTMVAGATGVDVALLVIAADDGVRPQTREHLAILRLLDVRRGVVALTKRDLVDDEWLALVQDEVRVLLADTPFAHAPVVPVAAPRGDGIAELRAVLVDALREAQPRAAGDLFRMPVDRVFTVRGTGTVVTGTVWSGTLARDAEVRLLPSGRTARVRGVQNHGQATDRILPGQRAAIALVGVDVADVARGDVVVADGAWQASTVLRADLALLDDAPRALGPRTAVRLHLGTAEVGARVVAADGSMEPGQHRPVRLMLDAPVVARAGDRFVLRSASPLATIGGGVISDPHAARRSRPFAETGLDAAARLATLLREAGVQGLAAGSLAIRLGVMPTQVEHVLRAAEAVLPVADRVIAAGLLDELEGRLVAELDGYHRDNPLAPAAPVHEIRARLGVPAWVADELVRRAVGAGAAELEGAGLRRMGWKPALSDAQSRLLVRLLERLSAAGKEPPSVPELEGEFGSESGPLLRHAARAGSVVQVELDRYYASGEFDQILARIETLMAGRDEVSPAELREGVGLSRKYLIPFLEYLDREGYTVRLASGRRWAGRGRRA